MNQLRWKCYVLSLLKIQHPDCELCNPREKYGEEMRKRLEELNWTQPRSHGDHGGAVGGFDSEPGEVISTSVSLKAQKRKQLA